MYRLRQWTEAVRDCKSVNAGNVMTANAGEK